MERCFVLFHMFEFENNSELEPHVVHSLLQACMQAGSQNHVESRTTSLFCKRYNDGGASSSANGGREILIYGLLFLTLMSHGG